VKKQWAGALLNVKCCCFIAKTIVKESCNFELAHLKKKKKNKTFWPSGDFLHGSVLSRCYSTLLGVLQVMKHSKMNGMLS